MAETPSKSKSNQELLTELGVEVKQEKKAARTPKEERIIAGFEEIQRFVDEHDRAPEHLAHHAGCGGLRCLQD